MRKHVIFPYKGTEEINIGMSLEEVRSLLGNDFENKPKVQDNITEIVSFNNGILLSFNNKILEYIGFLKNVEAYFNGINMLSLTLAQIRQLFVNDVNIIEDDSSIIFEDTGLSFYFSDKEENNTPDEMSIFKKNYYTS